MKRPVSKGEKTPVGQKVAVGPFGSVLPARSWEMPVERGLPAKIGRCSWAIKILTLEQNFLHAIEYAIDIDKKGSEHLFNTLEPL